MTKETFKEMVKKYAYYITVFVALIVIVGFVAVVGSITSNNQTPVSNSAIVYTSPILNGSILKDYSSTELQWNKTLKQWEMHKAIDYIANTGTNVYCFADGEVSNIYTNSLDGTCVEISHQNNLSTVYKFLDSSLEVKVGDTIKSGQKIGKVATGLGSESEDGAHLHFEIWKDGSSIDPSSYLDIGNK